MALARLASGSRTVARARGPKEASTCLLPTGLCSSTRIAGTIQRQHYLHTSRPSNKAAKAPEWASSEARTALEGFAERYASSTRDGKPVSDYRQVLDANQVHLARLTMASMVPLSGKERTSERDLQQREESILAAATASSGALASGVPFGSPLIPAEHLVFFTPRVASSTLGADGSDTSFNPPGGVFTRRMWAGGSMTWQGDMAAEDGLRVGDEAYERTYVEDAQLKQLGGGRGEMMVVWVRKEFGTERAGKCLVDRRSWVFQRALPVKDGQQSKGDANSAKVAPPSEAEAPAPPKGILLPTHLRQAPADLFRYSALTFNAHAIHLSLPWAQQVEGHPDIVVHGPLNLSLLLRKWGRDVAGWRLDEGNAGAALLGTSRRRLVSVEYRAKRPIYAGRDYWVGFAQGEGEQGDQPDPNANTHKVIAMLADGNVAMEATIKSQAA